MAGLEPMYTYENGHYIVNFPNRKALQIDEIKRIMGEFGEVKSVGCAGDEKGFRFVNFITEEGAKAAVEGLKHSEVIALQPRRKKNKSNPPNNTGSNWPTSVKSPDANSELSGARNNSSNGQRRYGQNNQKRDGQYNPKQRNDVKSRQDRTGQKSPNQRDFQDRGKKRESWNEGNVTAGCASDVDWSDLDSTTRKSSSSCNNGFMKQNFNHGVDNNMQIPSLLKVKCEIPDEMPKLCPVEKKSSKKVEWVTKPSIEVIVANLPQDYGTGYILHLFEANNPLAISQVRVVESKDIRYCHVFFENEKDAVNVEKKFDHSKLLEKKIIVQRLSALLKFA